MFDPFTLRGALQNLVGAFICACGAVMGINTIALLGRAIAAMTN